MDCHKSIQCWLLYIGHITECSPDKNITYRNPGIFNLKDGFECLEIQLHILCFLRRTRRDLNLHHLLLSGQRLYHQAISGLWNKHNELESNISESLNFDLLIFRVSSRTIGYEC